MNNITPIPLIIHDVNLDMSPLRLAVGKNSTLMLSIHSDPKNALDDLQSNLYSIEEINYLNADQWSVLHYLCRNSNNVNYAHALIQFLINYPNVEVNLIADSVTALSLAAIYSNTTSTEKTVELLLQYPNININYQNEEGWSALMMACRYSTTQSTENTVHMLLKHKNINVNLQNNDGWSALMMACRNSGNQSSENTVHMLLQHEDINVNLQNKNGWSALMMACRYSTTDSSEKTIEMLLQHKNIDVNLHNNDKRSALTLICGFSNPKSTEKIVQCFLQHPNFNLTLIKMLYVKSFFSFLLQKTNNINVSSNECSICLDNISNNQLDILLPCHHHYHFICIKNWFFDINFNILNITCPICRTNHF